MEEFLFSHALLSKINLYTDNRNVNKTYASLKVDSEEKEDPILENAGYMRTDAGYIFRQ